MQKLILFFVFFLFIFTSSVSFSGCSNGSQIPGEICDISEQVCAAVGAICEFYGTNSSQSQAPESLLLYLHQINDSLKTYLPPEWMLGRFPNDELYRYPRMAPEDVKLWTKFIQKEGKNYDSFDYDVPVGNGEDPGPSVPDIFRKDFIDLTKKRIDAVGYKGNNATIFEVKPRAGTTALGQLLTYFPLFQQTHKNLSSITLAVVTGFINTDELSIYSAHSIKVFLV